MAEPLTKAEQVANALIQAKGLQYGPRYGNPSQLKGSGFFGMLPRTDGSGAQSSELSGSMTPNGPEFPLIYQGISERDLQTLLGSGPIPGSMYDRASQAAQGRQSVGLPAFALEGEQSPRSQLGLPAPQYGIQPKRPL